MHRETFTARLTEIQQNVEQLLAQLQASEHDKFAAHPPLPVSPGIPLSLRASRKERKADRAAWTRVGGLARHAGMHNRRIPVPLPPCADRGPGVVEKIDKNKGSLKAVLGSL